jgi:hypothetical protein
VRQTAPWECMSGRVHSSVCFGEFCSKGFAKNPFHAGSGPMRTGTGLLIL